MDWEISHMKNNKEKEASVTGVKRDEEIISLSSLEERGTRWERKEKGKRGKGNEMREDEMDKERTGE